MKLLDATGNVLDEQDLVPAFDWICDPRPRADGKAVQIEITVLLAHDRVVEIV